MRKIFLLFFKNMLDIYTLCVYNNKRKEDPTAEQKGSPEKTK